MGPSKTVNLENPNLLIEIGTELKFEANLGRWSSYRGGQLRRFYCMSFGGICIKCSAIHLDKIKYMYVQIMFQGYIWHIIFL